MKSGHISYLPACSKHPRQNGDLRMLITEVGTVVDFVVNNHVKILLRRVGGDITESKFFRHVDFR
jgi:hypothetical protein